MTLRTAREIVDRALAAASTTREVVIGNDTLAKVAWHVRRMYPHRTPLIVADERTFDVAGRAVFASFQNDLGEVSDPIIFPATPTLRPDLRHVQRIREACGEATLPLAIGSGTINDLTKRAASEARLPYAVVATAPSMGGYTASGAALIRDGVKQTFECPAPELVFADLGILRDAPEAMIASGYGDLVGKITAGADWILADALGIEPILPEVWRMAQDPLRDMIAHPARFFRRDEESIDQLFQGLVLTGLAIQAAGTTRTASRSEHQFSHLWEMRGLEHEGEVVSHGKKVALGTIVSTTLYDRLLAYPVERLDVDATVAAWPAWSEMESHIRATHEHPMLVAKALEECRAKYVFRDELSVRLAKLRDQWPVLRERLRAQLLPLTELREMLEEGHCPALPEHIGLDDARLRESYLAAGQIRRRCTVFDILLEANLLEMFVDDLFSPRGYWSQARGA